MKHAARTGMTLLVVALAACSGNDEVLPIDAAVAVDAAPDAATDAAIDAEENVQMCVTSVSALTVGEGASAMFTARLAEMPAADVVANIASSDVNAATVAPTTLTFTAANYATPQVVTVAGVEDGNMMDETLTVMCTSAGIAATTVTVTVTDND